MNFAGATKKKGAPLFAFYAKGGQDAARSVDLNSAEISQSKLHRLCKYLKTGSWVSLNFVIKNAAASSRAEPFFRRREGSPADRLSRQPKLTDYENWPSQEIHRPYLSPALFLPSIITHRKIRLIRVW